LLAFLFGTGFALVARKKILDRYIVLVATVGQLRKRKYPLFQFDTEKRNRRKKRMDVVKLKRAHWKPPKYSAVCLKHVLDKDYSVIFSGLTTVDF